MFLVLISKFSDLEFLRPSQSVTTGGIEFSNEDDLDLGLYYLRTLSNIFRWAPDALWAILARQTIGAEDDYQNIEKLGKR